MALGGWGDAFKKISDPAQRLINSAHGGESSEVRWADQLSRLVSFAIECSMVNNFVLSELCSG